MPFPPIPINWGNQRFGKPSDIYDNDTVIYPRGINCILTKGDFNINDYPPGPTFDPRNREQLQSGNLRTVFGFFYPGWYTGPRGTWTEAQIRKQFIEPVTEAIYNMSTGATKLVGTTGPDPDILLDSIGGTTHWVVGAVPNSFPNGNYAYPCNSAGSQGMRTLCSQLFQTGGFNDGNTEIRLAIELACPVNSLQPPGSLNPLRGLAYPTQAFIEFDGQVGVNHGGGPCNTAPGVLPGAYIAEDDIEILNGRVAAVTLHEILHSVDWEHCSFAAHPYPNTSQLCAPEFEQNGPQAPCVEVNGNYYGADNMSNISWSAGCLNPYNVVQETHPPAGTKYIRGMGIALDTGGPWIPDENVKTITLSPGQSKTVKLWAHDVSYKEKQNMLTGVDSTLLLAIRRDVDSSQISSYDPIGTERHLYISYRKNAWFAREEAQSGQFGTLLNGAVIVEWGPVVHLNSGSRVNTQCFAKLDATDITSSPNKTYNSYTANGIVWPTLELRVVENLGSTNPAALFGPDSILVELKAI